MAQTIIEGLSSSQQIDEILSKHGCKKFLLVCGSSFSKLDISKYFLECKSECVIFSDFKVNPLYEDATKGLEVFRKNNCDSIIAVGGGSAIDVAKCIKLFSSMNDSENYLKQEFCENDVLLVAVPTTAGTGSESTRYAVIYYGGEKQSVTHQSIIPSYAILESSTLVSLPLFQKKCTLLDAWCQAIEAYWSVNSTDESKVYSLTAIEKIVKNVDAYLLGDSVASSEIMLASSQAGRAINIAQTTSAHAMSYNLTSNCSVPHGYAVAVCLPKIWRYMLNNTDKCVDKRGEQYLIEVFNVLAKTMGFDTPIQAVEFIEEKMNSWQMPTVSATKEEIESFVGSVNAIRLKNNPVALSPQAIKEIYENVLL